MGQPTLFKRFVSNIVVVVIVFYAVLFAFFSFAVNTNHRGAPLQATKQSMRTLRSALTAYESNAGFLPSSLDALTEGRTPYIEKIPRDAWKNPLIYLPTGIPGRPYFLRSTGKDGRLGTSDDIDVWTMDE